MAGSGRERTGRFGAHKLEKRTLYSYGRSLPQPTQTIPTVSLPSYAVVKIQARKNDAVDAELWAQWEVDWRRTEATARRRGWDVTALTIARPVTTTALRRLEATARQPVPPQLRAVLHRSARVAFGWHIPSHLQAMEREDMPTSSANRGAIWDVAHIEKTAKSYLDWRHTLAEEDLPKLVGSTVDWERLFPFYTLANGDLLAIDAASDGRQPVRYVSHEFDMLHGTVLAPDFFAFVTEMSKLGFAGTEWASWLRFGVSDGEAFHLRADSEGGKTWLAWLERDSARPVSDEPPPSMLERTSADRLLLLAAKAGDLDRVRAALEDGATPDATWNDAAQMEYQLWEEGYATPLTYAVKAGDEAMLDLLLAHGASPDTRRLAVGDAVEAAPPGMLTRLLEHGARVNGWKANRHWPLHLLVTRRAKAVAPTREEYQARLNAEEAGWGNLGSVAEALAGVQQRRLALYLTPDAYLAMLEALLAAGAEPDAPWDNGMTMLMRGDAATARVLLRHGADVHARDSFGGTALHGVRSPEVARLLVEHGADVNAPSLPTDENADDRGRTPLQTALLMARSRGLDMPRTLLALGADPRGHDGKGRSCLCYGTDVDSMRLLEPYGLDPLECLADGATLLHNLLHMTSLRAAVPNEVATLDHLLDLGIDINATDATGRTVLHVAAERMDNPADFQLLLDRGANRMIRDGQGKRPKDLVRRSLREVRALL